MDQTRVSTAVGGQRSQMFTANDGTVVSAGGRADHGGDQGLRGIRRGSSAARGTPNTPGAAPTATAADTGEDETETELGPRPRRGRRKEVQRADAGSVVPWSPAAERTREATAGERLPGGQAITVVTSGASTTGTAT